MGVEGGMKCVKFLLFIFNFVFWLCGLALVILGVLLQINLHNTLMISDASASGGPILVIGVGVVIFFIAFFGCCGAWKESYCMITTFAILLSLVIIVEISGAITGYVFRNKIADVVQDSLTEVISRYNNSTADFREGVDKLQESLRCCGVNSSADWRSFRPDGLSVPDSCCVNVTTNCGVGNMMYANIVHQEGCHSVVEALLKKNVMWVIVSAILLIFLEIVGIAFSCMLMKAIRSGYEVM